MDAKLSSQNENQHKELQIIPNISSTLNPQFKIPDDWVIEGRSRSNSPGHIDKYYYEPGTGKQFRSMISVQRYLSGETSKKVKRGNQKDMHIVPRVFKSHTLFGLPDDWIVEEIPRKNINYAGKVDKYYVEQETGKRFRSLVAVEKYLAEEEPSRRFRSLKELISSRKVEDSTPPAKVEDSTPPAKITWVLNGLREMRGGLSWTILWSQNPLSKNGLRHSYRPLMTDSNVPRFQLNRRKHCGWQFSVNRIVVGPFAAC